ncbi:hypothetical protein BpHYR1_049425 [Brachionus plicatilis]|uniref:Uncharacterized protein n=1 Tax=Brachionus plicatilis TaxID=10195 RepID=A0A3M7QIF3_BRAPC|nr:hypothetical protein BpHYR1_049425 [Brachionus plicatilis]
MYSRDLAWFMHFTVVYTGGLMHVGFKSVQVAVLWQVDVLFELSLEAIVALGQVEIYDGGCCQFAGVYGQGIGLYWLDFETVDDQLFAGPVAVVDQLNTDVLGPKVRSDVDGSFELVPAALVY